MASLMSGLYKHVCPTPTVPIPANPDNSSVFRRNYVFLGAVFLSAFAFEIAFDTATDRIWDSVNRGRQWKDIRHKYIEQE